jgi:hypothetical protein
MNKNATFVDHSDVSPFHMGQDNVASMNYTSLAPAERRKVFAQDSSICNDDNLDCSL